MVKGTTKQVVVVNGVDKNLFEQAIFLVRDDALMKGGITEEALLQQAREACHHRPSSHPAVQKAFWSLIGAAVMGAICAVCWLVF